ncbi:MAG: WD40 repeat domain-containing protein, partial [Zavarzinella sp.]|nr:WD40 repeat domain-containing protein [Zavarzinella sp.]
FSLPNGLQGYFIMDANNNRLNKALTAIVSDPKRPDKAVELGISCIGCHIPGIHPKADQVREHLEQNPKAVPKADAEVALALYPPKDKSLAQMEEDAKKFQAALALTGTKVTRNEPILAMTLRYEGDLDAVGAAAEVGLPFEEFQKRIAESESLTRPLGALRVPGGTVARQVWVQTFGDLVRELRLGTLFQANQIGASLSDNTGELDPLEVSAGQANQMAFSADGRRAVMASSDRSVRYYEVEGRRDLKRFIGHTASVWSVALSADGKQALSGAMDGSARLWDVESGLELRKLDGHAGLVTAVAFAPDHRAVTAGLDGFVILWDLDTGREIRRWRGPMKYVTAVAVSPAGDFAVVAADRVLRLWDLESGKQVRVYEGHTAAVTAVAYSDDGKRIVSGSDDQSLRLWDTESGRLLRTFRGHEGAVRSVVLSGNGQWALSAGSDATVRLWRIADGQNVGTFRKHGAPVVRAAFAANGRQTVSGDRTGATLIWDIERFMSKPIEK